MPGLNVVFFIRHFLERGTEVSAYDYAHYNETILQNKSYIVSFTPKKQFSLRWPMERPSYMKFYNRFPIFEINDISQMSDIIKEFNISFFYTQTHGSHENTYQFENKHIWGSCKIIKHCVFNTTGPDGDYYISISSQLNKQNNTNIPVIPYIVSLPNTSLNLREVLGIPSDAVVIGRHGCYTTFSIEYVKEFIREYIERNKKLYFLFLNTEEFISHPRVVYLPRTIDDEYKAAFINTCDVMLHARSDGETFGLAVAEFSSKNKPIITSPMGHTEHLEILKEKAIIYNSKADLVRIFDSLEETLKMRTDWNAYENYSPDAIIRLFDTLIFNPSASTE